MTRQLHTHRSFLFSSLACFLKIDLGVLSFALDWCGGETARTCAFAGRREIEGLLDRGRPDGFRSIDIYRSTDLTLFPSGSSIIIEKEANGKELQGCEVRGPV